MKCEVVYTKYVGAENEKLGYKEKTVESSAACKCV